MFCTIFTLFTSAALAQQPAGQNPPLAAKLFAGSADVMAMIANPRLLRGAQATEAMHMKRRAVGDRGDTWCRRAPVSAISTP
jgi:hypothetical protein